MLCRLQSTRHWTYWSYSVSFKHYCEYSSFIFSDDLLYPTKRIPLIHNSVDSSDPPLWEHIMDEQEGFVETSYLSNTALDGASSESGLHGYNDSHEVHGWSTTFVLALLSTCKSVNDVLWPSEARKLQKRSDKEYSIRADSKQIKILSWKCSTNRCWTLTTVIQFLDEIILDELRLRWINQNQTFPTDEDG